MRPPIPRVATSFATRRRTSSPAGSKRRRRIPFWAKIPFNYTRAEYQEARRLIAKMMTSSGVTSVTTPWASPVDLRAYQDARDAGELGFRVYCFIIYKHLDEMIAAGVRTRIRR